MKRSPPPFLGATYGQRGGSRICLLQLGRQVAGVTRGGRRGMQAKVIALIREAKNAHTPEDRRGKEKEVRTLRRVSITRRKRQWMEAFTRNRAYKVVSTTSCPITISFGIR